MEIWTSHGLGRSVSYIFWLVAGIVSSFYLEVISYMLGAVLAVLRGAPPRPLGLINVLSILDYQFSDERQLRSYLFTNGLGIFVAALFGALKLIWPATFTDAFATFSALAWKAALCCAWQMGMHNWKNLLDLGCSIVIRRCRLMPSDRETVRRLYEDLALSNAYLFAWLETYDHSSRGRHQLGYYKRDHEDAAKALQWAGTITVAYIRSDTFWSKLNILFAATLLSAIVAASTFPMDTYAGLLVLTYAIPACIRTAVDVFRPSQSFNDLEQLFILTVGQTTPTTLGLLINLIFYLATGKALFDSFESLSFRLMLPSLYIATLYVRVFSDALNLFFARMKWVVSWIKEKGGHASTATSSEATGHDEAARPALIV